MLRPNEGNAGIRVQHCGLIGGPQMHEPDMPFSTRIRGVALRGDEPGWSVENVFWWDTWALLEKYPHRILEGLAYTDYVLVLTPVEAMEWQRHLREAFDRDPNRHSAAAQYESVEAFSRRLEATQYDIRWVIVEMYEWESGMEG